MSYEGYEQAICANGHLSRIENYQAKDLQYCFCGIYFVWRNPVDDTNMDSYGIIPDEVFQKFLLTPEKPCKCKCGHTHIGEEATYRVPSAEETEKARHYSIYKNGKYILVPIAK